MTSRTRTEVADVVVIGSGAGGAVIAHAAARAGKTTLIVEKGPYVRTQDMTFEELHMLARLYKDGGLQFNTGMDMFIIQGSCVGGSTVVANNVMFRTPPDVLDEWKRNGAVFDGQALARSFDHIEKVLGTATIKQENVNSGSRLLREGAQAAGYDVHWMQKALGECNGCGGCNVGCTFGHKPSTLTTFIPWAEALGARVLADTNVERIEWKRGRATGLVARSGPDKEPVRILAQQIVVAGGAIGSSHILLRSGIQKNVGRRVSFNAGAACIAEFPSAIDAFDGDQMAVYIKGDDFTIEPVHHPPVSASLMVPGNFRQHGQMMANSRAWTYAGALVGTEPVGQVVHSPFFGHEETRFSLTSGDMGKLRHGVKAMVECFLHAGAKRVLLPTHRFHAIERLDQLGEIDAAFSSTKQITFGSSHPQGGNALSDDPEVGVVDHDFAVHGFENLFVCDASVFTSCIRVNPIDTIMSLADYAAPRILARA